MTYENFPGVIPLRVWDPLSLTNSMKKDTFNYVREAELHHNKLTSMAILLYWIMYMKGISNYHLQ